MNAPWDRKLWGVWFSSPKHDRKGFLIGDAWARPTVRAEEPTRTLLFTTRKAARDWCKAKLAYYADHDVCKEWKLKAVQVRERVTVIKK